MMRITNSMMMSNTKTNINNNKFSVDRLNTQMTTQKKITKPSDNPLIAIKSLRLSNTLSEINQYYNNNIKDAQAWMSVTETALTNMKDILKDAYRLCVNGSTGTLTDDDRHTILTQLKGLSGQLYAEANSDYANRTVFSGYKTNETVAFTDEHEAMMAKYEIAEQLDFTGIKQYTYYANTFETPAGSNIPATAGDYKTLETPKDEQLKRIRLSYDQLSDLNKFSYSCAVETTSTKTDGTTKGSASIITNVGADVTDPDNPKDTQEFQWRSQAKDSNFTYKADDKGDMKELVFEDVSGYKMVVGHDNEIPVVEGLERQYRAIKNGGTEVSYLDESGRTIFVFRQEKDASGNFSATTITDQQNNLVQLNYGTPGTNGDGTPGSVVAFDSVTDAQGNTIMPLESAGAATTITVYNADYDGTDPAPASMIAMTATTSVDADGVQSYELEAYDKPLADGSGNLLTTYSLQKMTNQEFEDHLSKLAAGSYTKDELDKFDETIIYLPDSGEMVLGDKIAEHLTTERAGIEVTYDKNGFKKGETRPEMYFNCTNKTEISPANHITYINYDEDGKWINQSINYAISANQDIGINTQIHDVISADTYRDLAEMTNIVQDAIDAHTTVTNIENMIKSGDYPGEYEQAYLKDCLEKAKKQMAYLDDHLQKIFEGQITNFEKYANKVNLAITDVGSRGDQVALTENRMSNQKLTFTELKSNNEDEELSDITIDYTSAYTAYQASLQAAGKIDDLSLLDYL